MLHLGNATNLGYFCHKCRSWWYSIFTGMGLKACPGCDHKRRNEMTDVEIKEFRKYIGRLDASFDEWKMLISFMVTEAAEEYTHREFMKELDNECHAKGG